MDHQKVVRLVCSLLRRLLALEAEQPERFVSPEPLGQDWCQRRIEEAITSISDPEYDLGLFRQRYSLSRRYQDGGWDSQVVGSAYEVARYLREAQACTGKEKPDAEGAVRDALKGLLWNYLAFVTWLRWEKRGFKSLRSEGTYLPKPSAAEDRALCLKWEGSARVRVWAERHL